MSRKNLSFLLFCTCLTALFVTLGIWQVQRLQWKNNLVRQYQERQQMEPIPLSAVDDTSNKDKWDQRRIIVTGKFTDKNFPLENKVLNGAVGYYVFTPFQSPGGIIFINRGWIAKDRRDRLATPNETITLTGTIHYPPAQKAPYVPDNEISPDALKHLFWIDLTAMQSLCCKPNAPAWVFYLDLTDAVPAAPDQPVPVNDRANLPNNHLHYAITWFALALITIIMSGIYFRRTFIAA